MPIPYVNLNGYKLAPFKHSDIEPFGGFSNNTPVGYNLPTVKEYPIVQRCELDGVNVLFHWPSAEHAYFAQSIIHFKQRIPPDHTQLQQKLMFLLRDIESIQEEFLPEQQGKVLIERYTRDMSPQEQTVFSQQVHVDEPDQLELVFMEHVLKMKLMQYPYLLSLAFDCARDGVFPIHVHDADERWASGKEGRGANKLGVLILQIGNELLKEQGQTPAIPDPFAAYKILQNAVDLSHDHLAEWVSPGEKWVYPRLHLVFDALNDQQLNFIAKDLNVSVTMPLEGGHGEFKVKNVKNNEWASVPDSVVCPAHKMTILHHYQLVSPPEIKKHYHHATLGEGRHHFWSIASTKGSPHLKNKYHLLKGDALKTLILIDFKSQLEACLTLDELKETVDLLKKSDEYKILAQSQGVMTSFFGCFGLKTSSVVAFDKMVSERESQCGVYGIGI